MQSRAYKSFQESLRIVESLLRIEKRYRQPTPTHLRKRALGIKGGSAVLMVAAFENYLKELLEEYLQPLTAIPLQFNPTRLPDKTRQANIIGAIKSVEKRKQRSKQDRIRAFEDIAKLIGNQVLIPSAFTEMSRGNPSPDRVRDLFGDLGIPNVFEAIKPTFEKRWGAPVASTFIRDTLDTIVSTRHVVAHSASGLDLSRTDLWDWLKFLRCSGLALDIELKKRVKGILKLR